MRQDRARTWLRDRLDLRARVVVRLARDCRNRIDTVRSEARLACEEIVTSLVPSFAAHRKGGIHTVRRTTSDCLAYHDPASTLRHASGREAFCRDLKDTPGPQHVT